MTQIPSIVRGEFVKQSYTENKLPFRIKFSSRMVDEFFQLSIYSHETGRL